jgi:hypothetical protein
LIVGAIPAIFKDTYTMCKTVHVLEPSKVHPYTPKEKQYLHHPRPPTPPLKSNCDESSTTIPTVHTERTQEVVGHSTILEEPAPLISSEEPPSSNTPISVQATPFIKTPLHRKLCFGTYVGCVLGVSSALLYHARYELTNPDLLPVHMLMLLIAFKLLYVVRHFQ